MKIVVFKKNASMIHSVVNIQFGFVDLLVGLFRQRAVQPCWHAQPHNFCLFVCSLLLLIGQHVFLNFTHHQNTL